MISCFTLLHTPNLLINLALLEFIVLVEKSGLLFFQSFGLTVIHTHM